MGFSTFISDVPNPEGPICWNPWNKVVLDHRDGVIDHEATNRERARRGLPVPWSPSMFWEEKPWIAAY